jgi:hypothetical protein
MNGMASQETLQHVLTFTFRIPTQLTSVLALDNKTLVILCGVISSPSYIPASGLFTLRACLLIVTACVQVIEFLILKGFGHV